MIFPIIILIISFLLDGVLSNFLPYMINDLSFFTPYFTLITLIIIYPFFQKQDQKYFYLVGITGFLYDLFYTNLFFTDTIFFLLIALIIKEISKKINLNALTNLFLIILTIILYHLIFTLALYIFNVVSINIKSICYLISHSLILNLVYGELLYFICKSLPTKRHLN